MLHHLLKQQPRMTNRQRNGRKSNHNPIQHDELVFIAHDGVPPPARHLRNAKHTSYEDPQVGQRDTSREHPEPRRS